MTQRVFHSRTMATYFEELNTLERYVETLRKSDADVDRDVAELEPTADELDMYGSTIAASRSRMARARRTILSS